MAFTNSNDYIDGRKPVPFPAGAEVVAVKFELELATGDLDLNDIGQIGVLPAGCIPVALDVYADDLDSGIPALVTSIGLLNSGEDDISTASADGGAAWATGVTTGQAAGAASLVSFALHNVTKSTSDRKIGVKVTTAAATAVAGTYGIVLSYRAA